MQCLKCGKETEENQVFCKECLEIMENYPVKVTTPVHLPQRAKEPGLKKSSRKNWSLSTEEQISHLKTSVHRLVITVVILSLLLVSAVSVLGKLLYDSHVRKLTGQNYAVETTATTTPHLAP